MYVRYVDRRSQVLGIMLCDEGYASCNTFGVFIGTIIQ